MLPPCQCCGVKAVELSVPYDSIMLHLCTGCFNGLKGVIKRGLDMEQVEARRHLRWMEAAYIGIPASVDR